MREDVETDGRRAIVHFGRDFAADALRRDFTINALSLSLDGSIHDYTGGIADLEARRVRFIGNARTRIREDYLRILRFFRFYAEYGQSEPDAEGLAASGAERAGLAILSRERIRHELMKILVARRSQETIRILAEHGFLTGLLGGAAEFGRFERVGAESNTGSIGRLAALGVMVPEDAERLRERLRLSNDEHGFLETYGNLVGILKSLRRTARCARDPPPGRTERPCRSVTRADGTCGRAAARFCVRMPERRWSVFATVGDRAGFSRCEAPIFWNAASSRDPGSARCWRVRGRHGSTTDVRPARRRRLHFWSARSLRFDLRASAPWAASMTGSNRCCRRS